MLQFRNIELSDKNRIIELLRLSDFMGCEYSFANNIAWRRLAETKICFYKDFYISCAFKNNEPVFTFPAGKGDYKDLFIQMKEVAEFYNVPLKVSSISNEYVDLINNFFPNQFEICTDEDNYDYIYHSEDLINLKGKKYHQKRNHLTKFYQNNWSFEPISSSNYDECIEFAVNSYNSKSAYDDESSVSEQFAINTFFNYFNELELKGGLIRVDDKIQGFTIGEKINSDTLCVHIEKANADIVGAYTAINNEFLKYSAQDCKYINREEDLGIDGLRKSKRSYYPCFQIIKNTITFRK